MANESTVAAAFFHVPFGLRARWNQLALKQTVSTWRNKRSDEYQEIRNHATARAMAFLAIDINNSSRTLGQYGYPSEWYLDYSIDDQFVDANDDHPVFDLYHEFGAMYIENIIDVATGETPDRLTPSEYFIWASYQQWDEKRLADAFGVAVGTVRSKVGRVREKREQASELLNSIHAVEHFDDLDTSEFQVNDRALIEVDSEEFPISSRSNSDGSYYEYTSYGPEETVSSQS